MLEVPPVGCVASLLVVHTNLVYCYTTLASLDTSPLYATLVLYKEENTITLSLLTLQELSFIKSVNVATELMSIGRPTRISLINEKVYNNKSVQLDNGF